MSFGVRIKKYIEHKGLRVRAFEMQSDLNNGAIHKVIKYDTSLNGDSISAIGKKWKDLNLNWLMVGEGNMLLDNSVVQDPVNIYNNDLKESSEVFWHKDALKRADALIKQQNETISALKVIIEGQKRAAEKAGIEL